MRKCSDDRFMMNGDSVGDDDNNDDDTSDGQERIGQGANNPILQPVAELRRMQINLVKSKGILKY